MLTLILILTLTFWSHEGGCTFCGKRCVVYPIPSNTQLL